MRSILATLKTALRALRRNKLRSGLTTLGIIIGVGTIVAMVGIGNAVFRVARMDRMQSGERIASSGAG